jgi:ABC-2 type transport system ATP-binding protein
MMGIVKATSGRVLLNGYDVVTEAQKAKAIAGFIPDRPFIYEKLSGKEFLQFVGKLHRMESSELSQRIAELLGHLELTAWQDELVESYSHGMKQRLVVCAALIHQPRILIVDEPMVGMDPKGARTLKDLFRTLAKNGTTIFLSTHSISVAEEICDRIGIIHKGRLIACGTMGELHRQAAGNHANLESVFLELTREQELGEAATEVTS